MKVFVNNKLYKMGKKMTDSVLNLSSEQVPFGVYAIKKDGIIELRKDKCRDKKELNRLIVDFQKKGFRVYFNGGTNESD